MIEIFDGDTDFKNPFDGEYDEAEVQEADLTVPLASSLILGRVFALSLRIRDTKNGRIPVIGMRAKVLIGKPDTINKISAWGDIWTSSKGQLKGFAKACGQPVKPKDGSYPALFDWVQAFKGSEFVSNMGIKKGTERDDGTFWNDQQSFGGFSTPTDSEVERVKRIVGFKDGGADSESTI